LNKDEDIIIKYLFVGSSFSLLFTSAHMQVLLPLRSSVYTINLWGSLLNHVDFPGISHTSKEALSVIQLAAITYHITNLLRYFLFLHSPKDIQANAKGGKFMQKDLTYLSPSVFVLCFLGQQAAVYFIK
jgi:hypothetical protein